MLCSKGPFENYLKAIDAFAMGQDFDVDVVVDDLVDVCFLWREMTTGATGGSTGIQHPKRRSIP